MNRKKGLFSVVVWVCCCIMLMGMVVGASAGDDLAEIKERGVLRHLGVPYAKFVTGSGDGLSVELIKLFAQHLGVTYEYVETDWKNVIGDLTGKIVTPKGDDIEILGEVPVRGDVIANGLTLLPWRQKVLDYSDPTFPSGVWLIARADSSLVPIVTSGDINVDIGVTKEMLQGQTVLTTPNSCLDPRLYDLNETTDSKILTFNGNPASIVPALLKNEAETSLLDIPDALIGLEK